MSELSEKDKLYWEAQSIENEEEFIKFFIKNNIDKEDYWLWLQKEAAKQGVTLQ